MPPVTERVIETRIGRGGRVESRHRAVAVAIPAGGAPIRFGDRDPGTFLRSVAKPFQTLVLFREGVVDHYGLTDDELAVITASHGGEPEHRRRAEGILRRGGFSVADLRCGTHPPTTASERRRMIEERESPDALANNCSGKHAGMLLLCSRLGADPARYLEPDQPVQRAVAKMLSAFLGIDLAGASATDGCSAPTWFAPIEAIARAFSRLGDRVFLAEHGLENAAERLHRALGAAPRLFSGEERFPFLWSPFLAPALLSKEGAEGVFVVWGEPGALAVKSIDGGERGYRYAVPALLDRLGWISPAEHARWRQLDRPVVKSVVGAEVGSIEVEIPG